MNISVLNPPSADTESSLPARETKIVTTSVSRGRALCDGGMGKCKPMGIQSVERANSNCELEVDRYPEGTHFETRIQCVGYNWKIRISEF